MKRWSQEDIFLDNDNLNFNPSPPLEIVTLEDELDAQTIALIVSN